MSRRYTILRSLHLCQRGLSTGRDRDGGADEGPAHADMTIYVRAKDTYARE